MCHWIRRGLRKCFIAINIVVTIRLQVPAQEAHKLWQRPALMRLQMCRFIVYPRPPQVFFLITLSAVLVLCPLVHSSSSRRRRVLHIVSHLPA